MHFADSIAVEQEAIVAAITRALLYLHASDVQHTNTDSIESEQQLFSKTGMHILQAYGCMRPR